MTAVEAAVARCDDCAGSEGCEHSGCHLWGFAKLAPSALHRQIVKYCRWCLCGYPLRMCGSYSCPIWIYREERDGQVVVGGEGV